MAKELDPATRDMLIKHISDEIAGATDGFAHVITHGLPEKIVEAITPVLASIDANAEGRGRREASREEL